jgi:hypothetical protein
VLVLAGCIYRLPVAFFLVELLHRSELEMNQGGDSGFPNKELAKSRICRRIKCFFYTLGAIVVMDLGRQRGGRLKHVDRVRAYQQWPSRWRRWRVQLRMKASRRHLAASSSSRRAAVFFPPGHVAIWEAVLRPIGRHCLLLSHPRRPMWPVPGVGEMKRVWRQ